MSRRAVLTVIELTLVTTALGAAVEILYTAAHLPDPAQWIEPGMVVAITALALGAAAALAAVAHLAWMMTPALRTWSRLRARAMNTGARQQLRRLRDWRPQLRSRRHLRLMRRRLRATLGRHASARSSVRGNSPLP